MKRCVVFLILIVLVMKVKLIKNKSGNQSTRMIEDKIRTEEDYNDENITVRYSDSVDDDKWIWNNAEPSQKGRTSDSVGHDHDTDDNRWVWDSSKPSQKGKSARHNTTNSKIKSKVNNSVTVGNICENRPWPPMPNFTAPRKRIAQQKCEQYLWTFKNILSDYERNIECFDLDPDSELNSIGGRTAEPQEFPHMGAILWQGNKENTWIALCGGTLISPTFTLTAAHCSQAAEDNKKVADVVPKVVEFGANNIDDEDYFINAYHTIRRHINKIIVHPEYKSPIKYNDIALMKFNEAVEFGNNIIPACLWHQHDIKPLGNKAMATGWGVTEIGSENPSPTLQVVELDVIDANACESFLHPYHNRLWSGVKDTQICAGKLSGGVDSCQGDSGGPLQVRIPSTSSFNGAMHYVIGVTSFGVSHKCGSENTPALYTRVSEYLDWIESHVWK